MMYRHSLAVAVLLSALSLAARAQDNLVDRTIKTAPGRDARVGIYTAIRSDCTSGPLPTIRLAIPPAHGRVTVRRGMLKATNFKQCLATEVPAFVAFYRAADGFTGTDEFELEIGLPAGRKQIERFRVNISGNPNTGQGI